METQVCYYDISLFYNLRSKYRRPVLPVHLEGHFLVGEDFADLRFVIK